ncbi:hypothetical protein Csp1_26880 [Corynebacterium provencense]|uniref:Type I restriction modification DNA specificity domain-containing protein n=1 Tax=Corynebacterium provencense TaxID=1737425 RepID=A0A2Z3YUS1_9CORY|nr:restriction endonuclease subunit S [Corynebacterium provencense]AWT27431.1 hypothetical protein Csp1_26880 [Corynebacterium provencense]
MSARKAVAWDGPYPLPGGWRWAKLGEVAEIVRAGVKPEDMSGDEPYLGLDCIAAGGAIERWTTTGAEKVTSNKFTFSQEHVLMGKLRPYLGKIALPEKGGLCSTDIIPILPGEDLDRRFLGHWLRTDVMVEEANKVATGANLPRISPKAIEQLDIPLPPLPEQGRIVEILDAANSLSEVNNKTVSDLQSTVPSLYVSRFGKIPLTSTVTEVAVQIKGSIRTGPFGSQLKKEEYTTEGVSVLGLDNVVGNVFSWGQRRYISSEKYESLKRYTVFPGDVLISIMATTGRCVVVPEDIPVAINTKHICAITSDRSIILPEFLRATFLWNSEVRAYLSRQTKGAIMSGLNMGIIKKMPVPVPSMSDQMDFVRQIRSIQHNMDLLDKRAAVCSELFLSLQSRAFRGEL